MKKTADKILYFSLIGALLTALLFGIVQAFFFDYTKTTIRITAAADFIPPVITLTDMPTTFFITQAQGIDLKKYATAFDETDGDITKDIVISAPTLTLQNGITDQSITAGQHEITFFAVDKAGNSSLKTTAIVVWNFVKLSSGYYHTLALTSHGRVYAWGYNAVGQLGDGTTTDRSSPVLLPLDNIIDVAAGNGCSFALDSSGQAFAWGRNENGRLGDGTTTLRLNPVRVKQPEGIAFTKISCRFATAGAITADGKVYTWGYGGYGASGTGLTADRLAPALIDLPDIVSLDMGQYNGIAITTDGNVYTWGDNLNGQLGQGLDMEVGSNPPAPVRYFETENIKIKDASCGFYHMTAVSESGELFAWGYAAEGRLGNNSTASKNTPQRIALPTEAASNVKKAIARYFHTGILTNDGHVYFCGQNLYGKFGNGNTTNALIPVRLNGVSDISDFSLAYDSSFVLIDHRYVMGMGYGGTGVLGSGSNTSSTTPVLWNFSPPAPS